MADARGKIITTATNNSSRKRKRPVEPETSIKPKTGLYRNNRSLRECPAIFSLKLRGRVVVFLGIFRFGDFLESLQAATRKSTQTPMEFHLPKTLLNGGVSIWNFDRGSCGAAKLRVT